MNGVPDVGDDNEDNEDEDDQEELERTSPDGGVNKKKCKKGRKVVCRPYL